MLFCVCHFRNSPEVTAFARHVLSLADSNRITICDNSGGLELALPPDRVLVSNPGKNLGYLNGSAHARRAWTAARGEPSDLTVVCNTDITLSASAVNEEPRILALSGVAGIAPDVRLVATGRPQNPHLRHRPATRRIRFLRAMHGMPPLGVLYMLASLLRARQRPSSTPQPPGAPPQNVYAPHGAIMVFHPDFFQKGGRLEYGGFLHDEELHVAEQSRRLGLAWRYWPAFAVQHLHHASLGSVSLWRQSRWHRQSLNWIWIQYFTASTPTRP